MPSAAACIEGQMCPEVARAPHVPRSPLPYPRGAGGGRAVHLSNVHKERSAPTESEPGRR